MHLNRLIDFYHAQHPLLQQRLLVYWQYVANSKSNQNAPLFQELLGALMLEP